MPPTPDELLIQQQAPQLTVPFQPPQTQEQVTPTPIVKEGEVSMPTPQQWVGPIDYGMNWYALGKEAFDAALKIYPQVLEYNVKKRQSLVMDAIYDAETKTFDGYTKQKQTKPPSFLASPTEVNDLTDINSLYEQNKKELKTKIDDILGFDKSIFDEDFDFNGVGMAWMPVIEGARRGYKDFAQTGERVQRDALLTRQQGLSNQQAFANWMTGFPISTKQNTEIQENARKQLPGVGEDWIGRIPQQVADSFSMKQNVDYIVDENTGEALFKDFWKAPREYRKQQVTEWVQANTPKTGFKVPDIAREMIRNVGEQPNFSTINPQTFELVYDILPQLNDIQIAELKDEGGKNLSDEAMSRIRMIRHLGKSTGLSTEEAFKLTSKIDLPTLQEISKVMSSRLAISTQIGQNPAAERYKTLEDGYSKYFIKLAQSGGLDINANNLNDSLRRNPFIRDAYISGLSIWVAPEQELNKNDREKVTQSILESSLVAPHTYTIKTKDADGVPIFTPTGLIGISYSLKPEATTRLREQAKTKNVPTVFKEMLTDETTGDVKLVYAANLSESNLYEENKGDLDSYTELIASSFDSSFSQTRTLFPVDKLKRLTSLTKIQRNDLRTGQVYDAGISKAVLYQYTMASSDQVLTYFNGGTPPKNNEETMRAFNLALQSIPPADRWGWKPDLSLLRSARRQKNSGDATIDMVLYNVPLSNGINLMNEVSVIPVEQRESSLLHPKTKQPLSFYSDPKDEDGTIDIQAGSRDVNNFLRDLVESDTKQTRIVMRTTPKTIQDPTKYFILPKTNEQLVGELQASVIRASNRDISKDTIIIGEDKDMDTKAEFAMAIHGEMPFLIKHAEQTFGISQQQATEIYSSILTDEAINALYERSKGSPFIHSIADISLSTRQFINNEQVDQTTDQLNITSDNNPVLNQILESLKANQSNRNKVSSQTINGKEPNFVLFNDIKTGQKYWVDTNDPVTTMSLAAGPDNIRLNYYGPPDKTPQKPKPEETKFSFSKKWNDQELRFETTQQIKPTKVTPYPYNVTTFDTILLPAEEQAFLLWKNEYAPNDSGQDYDLRGAFKAGLKPDATGHWPDDWKKPSHPTFSTDSVYASIQPDMAGSWNDAPADGNYPEDAIIDENTGQYFIKPNSKKTETIKQVSPGAVKEKPTGWYNIITATDGSGEGLKLNAYQDAGGVWTVGLGTTRYLDGTPVKKGDTISKEQAEEYANDWVETKVIPRLSETIPTWNKMTPQQQGALISFAYNAGENFYGHNGYETITKALSKVENFKDVPKALALYNKGYDKKQKKKVVMGGLVKRRKAEADLWSSK